MNNPAVRLMKYFVPAFLLFTAINNGITAQAVIILTSDKQLNDLLDPDRKIDLSLGIEKKFASLREVCETARKSGEKTLIIAFDEFFRQYREQAGTERLLTPDMDEYIEKIKKISDFAAGYRIGLELSLLSPLELGKAYQKSTGEGGRWLGYKTGYRDPSTGKFSMQMWQQLFWTNNKGKFQVDIKNVRAFAFRESPVGDSPFKSVNPDDIIEIKGIKIEALDTVKVGSSGELLEGSSAAAKKGNYFLVRNLRVYYDGDNQLQGYNRVFVILEYESPEIDYFSPDAPLFLKSLLKKYRDKGVNLVSLYSDEMHIQQDWYYFQHHENGQFNLRYLTSNMSEAYFRNFGQKLDDKYLLYFVYGAPWYGTSVMAVRNIQYVMGPAPEDIHRTFLMRDRYYKMLNNGVTDLFIDAKTYAEQLFGRELVATGHSSWAESPTIDFWETERLRENAAKYEYTSNYVWGNTVHQASAACYDYFKWGEYLVPTGNDFAECGWLDRDYYGAAMAASIGVINKVPDAYAAAWGMPDKSREWKDAINTAFGARNGSEANKITGNVHRDIEVLILYPMNLVAVEERFGSWMTQYAYANFITSEKLLELGKVTGEGFIEIKDKKYNTLVALFEPLPSQGLLKMMSHFVKNGGKVLWCGCPPLLNSNGEKCTSEWEELFGVNYNYDTYMGEIAAGRKINFLNSFKEVPEQTILTDFLVDRIYPVSVNGYCEILAKSEDKILGTRIQSGKGMAFYFGFRPRDDQSASLGYESRTLFEILNASGAYNGSGRFNGINDNPTYISRTTDFLATRFPNGSSMIVKHYRTHPESWDGGFSRNQANDENALALNPLPSDTLVINELKINGHQVSYKGKQLLIFNTDSLNRLIAFEGHNCREITVDGILYDFAHDPFKTILFYKDYTQGSGYLAILTGEGKVTLPIRVGPGKKLTVTTSGNKRVQVHTEGGKIELFVTPQISGKRLNIDVKD
jgi:hypothetical protein